jgi:hypothetical protein
MHGLPLRCMLMFRAFWILFAIVMIAAQPVQAERADNGDNWTKSSERRHRDPGDYQDIHTHRAREHHARRSKRSLYSGPGVLMVPGYGPFGAGGFQTRLLVTAMPIKPPSQFSYYCNNPSGFYPSVSGCAGPWLETGAQISTQEHHP